MKFFFFFLIMFVIDVFEKGVWVQIDKKFKRNEDHQLILLTGNYEFFFVFFGEWRYTLWLGERWGILQVCLVLDKHGGLY